MRLASGSPAVLFSLPRFLRIAESTRRLSPQEKASARSRVADAARAGREAGRPYTEVLDELLALEIRSKAEKHLAMRTAMARFPFQKTLDAFDFKFQPSIDPKVIRELATGRYLG
jgi:DNA replication protein DnaC